MMRWVGLILAIAVVGVAFGANSSDAHAHAQYIRSQPEQNSAIAQSPIEVLIWFTESVEIQYSEIQFHCSRPRFECSRPWVHCGRPLSWRG